jgi:hypothetical protein
MLLCDLRIHLARVTKQAYFLIKLISLAKYLAYSAAEVVL